MAKASKRHAAISESHFDILEILCSPVVCTLRGDGLLSATPTTRCTL